MAESSGSNDAGFRRRPEPRWAFPRPGRGRLPGPSAREPAVDLYRVVAVVVVVLGHWLAASVTYTGGRFADENVLAALPWTRWLTWVFQVIPVFFLVAGYGGAASWTRWPGGWADWLRHRLTGVAGPVTAYVVAMLVAAEILRWCGASGAQLAYGAWAVALHLWFLPVYLVLVLLTPAAAALQRRWAAAPVLPAVAVVLVDALSLTGLVPVLGWANYLLGWGAVFQLGIAWHAGVFSGRRPLVLAGGALGVLAVLVWLGPYPVSMVGVPGEAVRNTSPPNAALLAFAAVQAGLLVSAAPAVTARIRRRSARANASVLAVYLWHMVPVVVVALVGYPPGLFPQPHAGSPGWWAFRVPWLLLLAVVMAAGLALLAAARRVTARWWPVVGVRRWAGPVLLVGVGVMAFALFRFAVHGFAPDGRFPAGTALLYLAGVGLVGIGSLPARGGTAAERPLVTSIGAERLRRLRTSGGFVERSSDRGKENEVASLIPRTKVKLPAVSDWFDLAWPFGERYPVRIEETAADGKYTVRAELPGFDPEKGVHVSAGAGSLTISAEREATSERKGRSEFRYGSFSRTVSLPEGAETAKIAATYANGILEVTVPYEERETGEQVEVPITKN
ncbi:Hsp20/alpha crystallin family protein [Amycolatopsis mongoliensis]|uniref:Hsp20/alpha crystallin family protein n=1 Tax=Amycolatopsis mongoliensis TaxID=715475 RepID=A0A9Y2JIC1_9PSEU|nr:Hsp20/alpha crystallin family protein [Amycolatopsis sp. 4-36]WIX98254.1 Hsp20/alpha crystallin family protein [Amycolatopsis sp. 4-36]